MKSNFVKNLLLLVSILFAAHAVAITPEVKKMNTCIAAAQEILDIFDFKKDSLSAHCSCVKNRKFDQLPIKKSDWKKTGQDSAQLALIECAKNDVVQFYDDAVFKSAKTRLAKDGVSTQKMKVFSSCVAPYAYEELRLAAATDDSVSKNMDKNKFKKNYSHCEAKIN